MWHSQEKIISVAGKYKDPIFKIKQPQDRSNKVIRRRQAAGKERMPETTSIFLFPNCRKKPASSLPIQLVKKAEINSLQDHGKQAWVGGGGGGESGTVHVVQHPDS